MKNFLNNPKFKNPVFWASLVAIIFGFAGVDFNTLTSWPLLIDALMSIFKNPVSIIAVIIGMTGVLNDNSTPGVDFLKSKK